MAQIINITPQPQDDYSQTAPARAGAAAAAPPVQGPLAPGRIPGLPAFSMEPNQAPDPAVVGPVDNTRSPFSQLMSSPAFTSTTSAEQARQNAYAPLAQAPGLMDHITNFFSRQDPNAPNIDQRAAAADFYARPEVQNVVQGNKSLFDAAVADPVGMHAKLEPLINAAQNAPIASANGKPVQDQAGLAANVQRTGMHENVVHPFHEPHAYTEEEFVNATRGINWDQLQQLQGLQHYLPPAQQAAQTLVGQHQKLADAAKAAYDDAVQRGQPQGVRDTLAAKKKITAQQYMNTLRNLAIPGTALPAADEVVE
jgi:hypothetical protein